MKKTMLLAAALLCMAGCKKDDAEVQKQNTVEPRLELRWDQSDNIKPYTAPQIAYRIPGSDVIVEAPSTKVIPLTGDSGRVELSFFSGSTGKNLSDFITGAKSGETVSYYFYAGLKVAYGDYEYGEGSSLNYSPLSQSYVKNAGGVPNFSAEELGTIIFDEFNSPDKYTPEDKKTKKFQFATGKQRKLVFTWEKEGDRIKVESSYEDGSVFPDQPE